MKRCKNGHEMSAGNTGSQGSCKICGKNRAREKREMIKSFIGPPEPPRLCKRGHLMTPENAYLGACKICKSNTAKKRYARDREIFLEIDRKYYQNNKESVLARCRKYRHENKEKMSARSKRYYETNKDEANRKRKIRYANNKGVAAESDRRYSQANLEKKRAWTAKRRAAKLQRTPPWIDREDLKLINSIYAEARLLEEITGEKHHVDHIVPLQGELVSGLHVPWNLQILTAEQNISKGNKFC